MLIGRVINRNVFGARKPLKDLCRVGIVFRQRISNKYKLFTVL
jgi:hypothetical protein